MSSSTASSAATGPSSAATSATAGASSGAVASSGPGGTSSSAFADPVDRCAEVRAFVPQFQAAVQRLTAQDDAGTALPVSPVVFVGSSSIRRWEYLARVFSDEEPVQRGVGGMQLGEVALFADALVNRHNPRAVVVYAGTNDVAAGVAPSVVVERFRCFRQRVGNALGWDRPVLFVAITPNPARWSQWSLSAEVNAAVAALAQEDPALTYVDVATPFLALGSPPPARLFVADGLHLSPQGYALWESILRPAVTSVVPPLPASAGPTVVSAVGTRVLLDVGPTNAEDGERTPSPDYLGQHWNNWHDTQGDGELLPGEHLDALVDDRGLPTGMGVVLAGGFGCNGRMHGGLLWPSFGLLGPLAVGSATGDFFYATDENDQPGALYLRGLDPRLRYTLRFFAARQADERRVTRYRVLGAAESSVTLQTSGTGAGAAGATTNDDTVAELAALRPDAWGHLFVDVIRAEGSFAYLSALEVRVESAGPPP